MSPQDVVVVGAGAAGLGTVEALRREGCTARVTIIGDENDLPYDRPPLSKGYLSGAWDEARLQLRPRETLAELGATWKLGHSAVSLDREAREVRLEDGSTVHYDALVIATGVRSRRLPGTEGISGLHTMRTRADADRLREEMRSGARLLVGGGGFLGSETAASARTLGCEVTLISRRPAPLGDVLGDEVAGMLAALHRERGVDLEQGSVDAVTTADGHVTGVRLADGRELPGDMALLAIGSIPNVEWLRDSGLTLDDGVVCDASGLAAPGVWAVGDVAAWHDPGAERPVRLEHRTRASEHGISVARSILGAGGPLPSVPYVWSDQYEYTVQIHGSPRGADRFAIIDGSLEERGFTAVYGRDDRVCAAVGVNMVRPLRALRRLVAQRAPWEAVAAAQPQL
ncbi:NAD(P)/FAD-dependent oxidoreductase [Brachybacterium sp. ACRRE]|uniref:NAD(P)/FAD-dependent oxidoreductase n=1 Tax=Brachybacterium sp. ACRRE TaxID=2918184 RepID=UPI001EF3B9FF|nr:FAD-dependent oxidoreductase [Brachybacterium sp. ACRRE]MCG7308954.1 FAD-dependent oxidoreductase [Brachybacterium sp. ACRRE]